MLVLGRKGLLNHPKVAYESQLRLEQALLFANKHRFSQARGQKHTRGAEWAHTRVNGLLRSNLGALVRKGFYTKKHFSPNERTKNTTMSPMRDEVHYWVVKRVIGRPRSEMGARVTIGFDSKFFFNQSSAHKTPKCGIRVYLGARAKLWARKRVFVSPIKTFLPQESAQ